MGIRFGQLGDLTALGREGCRVMLVSDVSDRMVAACRTGIDEK